MRLAIELTKDFYELILNGHLSEAVNTMTEIIRLGTILPDNSEVIDRDVYISLLQQRWDALIDEYNMGETLSGNVKFIED